MIGKTNKLHHKDIRSCDQPRDVGRVQILIAYIAVSVRICARGKISVAEHVFERRSLLKTYKERGV